MSAPHRPTVVLWSAPGTLAGLDPWLRRAGVRLVRLVSVEPRPVEPRAWLGAILRAPTPDTVLVTSRAAVEAGIRPWRRAVGRFPLSTEFWAVGPGTSAALRDVGIRRVRRAGAVGSEAVVRSLNQGPPRRILYLRSDRAGPELARYLRVRGHRVVDRVVYRLESPPRRSHRVRQELARADLLVVTSPSGLSELRRQLDRRTFARLSHSVPLVVLGERSQRSARRRGFRRTSVAPSTSPYRFSRHLLRELRHGRA